MTYKTMAEVWDDPARPWPCIVYVSTTNLCNANCFCCVNDRVQKPRGIMSLDDFRKISDKISRRGLKIGAMFCFGEPLMDPTLTYKYAYAQSIDVLSYMVGLNTNCTYLTPDRYEGILQHTPNITLSFWNTGEEYERMTGLNWEDNYRRAIDFISYRDAHKPDYMIFIGVNRVPGYSLSNVQRAFEGQNVVWVQDVEFRHRDPVLTGPLNRLLSNPSILCDGHRGVVQVHWNCDCEYCAFDMIGSKEGGDTKFGNLLTDSWEDLEKNFRRRWKEGSKLCCRCDYWNRASSVIDAGMQLPNPLPPDWDNWKLPFCQEGHS